MAKQGIEIASVTIKKDVVFDTSNMITLDTPLVRCVVVYNQAGDGGFFVPLDGEQHLQYPQNAPGCPRFVL